MLKFFRKHARGWFMTAIIGIIIVVFVLYFGSSRGGRNAGVIATVDKKVISDGEFYKEYERLLEITQRRFGAQLTPEMLKEMNLKQVAFDNLLNRQIIIAKANDLKIEVSDEELRTSITSLPILQSNGMFDEKKYQQILRFNRMTPGDFESLQRAELTANKIELLIREGIKVSTKEVYDFYVFQNQKVNLNFVRIAFANFEKKIVPSQQELEDFLKNNGNLFRVSEQIKIKYLFFAADNFAPDISDTDINDYYRSHKKKFVTKEGKPLPLSEVRGIIIRELKKNQGMLNAYAEAKKAREIIYQEDNMEAYARKNNLKIYNTDYFPINKTPEEFSAVKNFPDTIIKLQTNELSKILNADNGYYLLKVTDRKASYVPKLADIEQDVKRHFISKQSQILAEKEAQFILDKVKAGENFEKLIQEKGFFIGETGFFQPGNNIPRVGSHKDALDMILQLSARQPYPAKPLLINDSYFIFRLKDIQKPGDAEFEKQKTIYENALLAVKKEEAFRTWLEGNKIAMIKEKRVRIKKQIEDL